VTSFATKTKIYREALTGGGGVITQRLKSGAFMTNGTYVLSSRRVVGPTPLLRYASHVACLHVLSACTGAQNPVSALNSNASSLPPLQCNHFVTATPCLTLGMAELPLFHPTPYYYQFDHLKPSFLA